MRSLALRAWLWSGAAVLSIAIAAYGIALYQRQGVMLAQERERRLATEALLDKKQYQFDFAMNKLEYAANAKGKNSEALSSARKEKRSLEKQVQEYAERLHRGEPEVIIFTRSELPSDISSGLLPQEMMAQRESLEGKILGINEDYNLVIISLGRQDGAKLGDALSVYRENRFIGSLKVVEVEPSTCIAAALPNWRHVKFRENDQVAR
ncbi:MAG: hypothetical protein ABH875_06090 [Candidatus Omnitrophota bacterium]